MDDSRLESLFIVKDIWVEIAPSVDAKWNKILHGCEALKFVRQRMFKGTCVTDRWNRPELPKCPAKHQFYFHVGTGLAIELQFLSPLTFNFTTYAPVLAVAIKHNWEMNEMTINVNHMHRGETCGLQNIAHNTGDIKFRIQKRRFSTMAYNGSACCTNIPSHPWLDPPSQMVVLQSKCGRQLYLRTKNKSGFEPQNRYGEKRVHIKRVHFVQCCLHVMCLDNITMKVYLS